MQTAEEEVIDKIRCEWVAPLQAKIVAAATKSSRVRIDLYIDAFSIYIRVQLIVQEHFA